MNTTAPTDNNDLLALATGPSLNGRHICIFEANGDIAVGVISDVSIEAGYRLVITLQGHKFDELPYNKSRLVTEGPSSSMTYSGAEWWATTHTLPNGSIIIDAEDAWSITILPAGAMTPYHLEVFDITPNL